MFSIWYNVYVCYLERVRIGSVRSRKSRFDGGKKIDLKISKTICGFADWFFMHFDDRRPLSLIEIING